MINQTALTLGNVSWLLAAMAFVIAPHASRLPLWVTAVCLGVGGWRWWIARHALKPPPWWVMGLLAVAVAAGARLEYGRLFGRDVGVMLLIVMLCLKVLEMRMKRDAVLTVFLGFFLAMTNFLYSQTILMGAYMLGCVWIFVATLIGFNRVNTEPTLRERLVPAFWLLVQAIPLMLVLFFLFPRLSGPLWRMPGSEGASSGLSDEMSPGDISKLSLSDAIAFRVDFDQAVPQNSQLYWRGPVLGEQVGRRWRMYQVRPLLRLNYTPQSPPVAYRVTLQPHNKPWLFALDLPATVPEGAFVLGDYQLRAMAPVSSLRSYTASSHLDYAAGDRLTPRELAPYLQVDRTLNPRTIAYAEKLKAEQPDPLALIDTLMARYNTEFEYTLQPPLLGAHPVDEFLFETKRGFCEHYAGSFVLILRAAGIPARVVTGYQGGEVNPITRQLVVRQAEAHAWAEVWLAGRGWVRADPTFAVSPLRINRGMTEALGPQGMLDTLLVADRLGILKQIAFGWDAVNNRWNQWIIGFNQDRQRSLMETLLGARQVDWQLLSIWLLGGVFGVGMAVAAVLLLRIYRTPEDPLVAAYRRFCEKAARLGVARAPHEGPRDHLDRFSRARPDLADRAREVVDAYVDARYAPLAPASRHEATRRLRALVRRFQAA